MAIDVLIPVRSALSVQPMIDAALEDPSLAPQVVAALGALRFDQARFYLEKVMMEGPPSLRPVAAASLTQIGGAALAPLKNALKAPDRDTRLLAARALLPAATERELGALYDFIRDHGNDDPALTQALRGLTVRIEQAIAARDAANAAGAPKDF
jgi:HEAT repeat protein